MKNRLKNYSEKGLKEISQHTDKSRNIILISIKSNWYKLIKKGIKTVEIRRNFTNYEWRGEILYFYVASPIKKILGWTIATSGLEYPIDEAWEKFKDKSAISERKFKEYTKGKKKIFCIEINDKIHDVNLDITDFGIKHPPQNYMYLFNMETDFIKRSNEEIWAEEEILEKARMDNEEIKE